MSKDSDLYWQCKLRDIVGGNWVAWIPAKCARPGNLIKIKDDEGNWQENVIVVEVFEMPVEWKVLNERSRDYLRTREASDI